MRGKFKCRDCGSCDISRTVEPENGRIDETWIDGSYSVTFEGGTQVEIMCLDCGGFDVGYWTKDNEWEVDDNARKNL